MCIHTHTMCMLYSLCVIVLRSYMYIYIYIYRYIHMHTYIRTCICIYVCMRNLEQGLPEQAVRRRGLLHGLIIVMMFYTSRFVRVILAQGPC